MLSYVLAWGLWLPMVWRGITVGPGDGWPSHLPGLLAPALAALLVTGATGGRAALMTLLSRLRWRWSHGPGAWRAVLLMGLTLLCVMVPALTAPRPALADFLTYSGAPAIGGLVILYIFVVNGVGEELGWRGFLVDRLLPRLGPLRTSALVWLVWVLWHLPLFALLDNFRALGMGGVAGWLIGIGAGSIVLTWLYISTGRSVLATAIWHVSYNFATATVAATALSAGLASTLVMAVCVGLLLRPALWRAGPAGDAG